MKVIRFEVTTNGGKCKTYCKRNYAGVGSVYCRYTCAFNDGRYSCDSGGLVFCKAFDERLISLRSGSLNRTKSTHVRKFDGVWYQLISFSSEDLKLGRLCYGCSFLPEEAIAICDACDDCQPGYIFNNGGIWKEIGKK